MPVDGFYSESTKEAKLITAGPAYFYRKRRGWRGNIKSPIYPPCMGFAVYCVGLAHRVYSRGSIVVARPCRADSDRLTAFIRDNRYSPAMPISVSESISCRGIGCAADVG